LQDNQEPKYRKYDDDAFKRDLDSYGKKGYGHTDEIDVKNIIRTAL